MSNLKEAEKVYDTGYYKCPHCLDAVYHEYSFTHNPFICKDCNNEFTLPKGIKLNKPKQFKKKPKEKRNG